MSLQSLRKGGRNRIRHSFLTISVLVLRGDFTFQFYEHTKAHIEVLEVGPVAAAESAAATVGSIDESSSPQDALLALNWTGGIVDGCSGIVAEPVSAPLQGVSNHVVLGFPRNSGQREKKV